MLTRRPFDAVLIVSFGGPQGPGDIRPFLANVVRGRRISPERIEEVAAHYELFGGVSPLTAITMRQADALRGRLGAAGLNLPVYVGMRNWHPLLPDTVAEMSRDGVRRAVAFIGAAHRSYSSCTQYRQNVADARAALAARGLNDVSVTYVDDWHEHPGFIDTNASHTLAALESLPLDLRDSARIVFTAHSIPSFMPGAERYQLQLHQSAALVAERLNRRDWALVYQSRSGRPEDPWLGPDVCDYLRDERTKGLRAVVICPIGFICDHVEVLYDLDHEAASVCRELGLPMARAETVNDDPAFVGLMEEMILRTWRRYEHGIPLPLAVVPGTPPSAPSGARTR
ncbi:MAG: ferrochelatase [Vicinamibacterales bacterium]